MNVKFVAEVSSNHHQDLNRCIEFIDTSAEIGCSAVKFQLFKIDELFSPEILTKSQTHRSRKAWELPVSFLPELADRCREKQIQFGCTPFYLDAVAALLPYVDFYKIASYEILWKDLLVACARTGKPVVISTGMATMEEIETALNTLLKAGCNDLTVLHCVSGYPTPVSECNLAAIETIRSMLHKILPSIKTSVGWSDHSVNAGVLYRAVHRWGSEMVEFHLDLDGEGEEFNTGHCWLPHQINIAIDEINKGFQADGSGKKEPVPSELSDRNWRADPEDGLRPLKQMRKVF